MQTWAQTIGTGKHVWGVIHENGKMYLFCASNGLVVRQTPFPCKKSDKLIWRSLDGTSENQIGHVATAEHGGAGKRTVRSNTVQI